MRRSRTPTAGVSPAVTWLSYAMRQGASAPWSRTDPVSLTAPIALSPRSQQPSCRQLYGRFRAPEWVESPSNLLLCTRGSLAASTTSSDARPYPLVAEVAVSTSPNVGHRPSSLERVSARSQARADRLLEVDRGRTPRARSVSDVVIATKRPAMPWTSAPASRANLSPSTQLERRIRAVPRRRPRADPVWVV